MSGTEAEKRDFRLTQLTSLILDPAIVGGFFSYGVSTLIYLTALDTRRVDVEVGVDYAGDIDATRETLEAAAKELDLVFTDPPPHAVLTGLGASSVDWSLRCWCKTADYWAVREALIRAAKRALDAKQLGIPFPQVDVHLDGAALEALGKK